MIMTQRRQHTATLRLVREHLPQLETGRSCMTQSFMGRGVCFGALLCSGLSSAFHQRHRAWVMVMFACVSVTLLSHQ